jgi:dTDP-glucose 4,6-dehydratase
MTILVTGGAGFIGSAFVLRTLARTDARIVTFDKLTYAGNLENLASVLDDPRHRFVRGDITDAAAVHAVMAKHAITHVVNFAAESHVDRSIRDAAPFLATNVVGVQVMLDACRANGVVRMVQVSTDEVYGSLPEGTVADEAAALHPGSPYAASKAAGDLLCMAAVNTHGMPVIVTRCSNNYGPRQHPEKLLPLALSRAVAGESIPVYGDGMQKRDWLHVNDHVDALLLVLDHGENGKIYNVATGVRRTNRDVLLALLTIVGAPESLMTSVTDRLGHDRRYAPDASRITRELGWQQRVPFDEGLAQTVAWYRENQEWVAHVLSGAYQEYFREQYAGLETPE